MKDKIFLFYYFLDGAFHSNATYFMLNALTSKLDKYMSKIQFKWEILFQFKFI